MFQIIKIGYYGSVEKVYEKVYATKAEAADVIRYLHYTGEDLRIIRAGTNPHGYFLRSQEA